LNDTISWVESLADLRSRDKKFARDIVENAKVASAKDALQSHAIDFAGEGPTDFLKFCQGRNVKMKAGHVEAVQTSTLQSFEPDLRYRLLELVTHPQIAYLLFMASLALLYFEVTHPGMFLPGVAGAVGLVISLISFHLLEVRWGGLALLILGLIFLVAEAFVPSFGALGVGGIIAFVMGSIFLFDPAVGTLPLTMILPTALGLGFIMMGLAFLALRTRRVKKRSGFDVLIGAEGRVSSIDAQGARHGMVEVSGELWKFESDHDLKINDMVRVTSVHHFTLKVSPRSHFKSVEGG
jgi:membrane-bound serine protease (ClpP class)